MTGLGSYLVAHGVLTDTQGSASSRREQYRSSPGRFALAPLAWSFTAKYRSRVKLMTALDAPAGADEQEVKEKIARGYGSPVIRKETL
jgi:hypothetical protein